MDTHVLMKPSMYNIFLQKEDGVAIYNTRTGKLVRSFGERAKIVNEIFASGGSINYSDISEKLYKDEFLIDAQRNEVSEMEKLEETATFDRYLRLIILPTEYCNFRCVYCYEHFKRGKMSKNVQNALIKTVEQEIEKYEGLVVSWFGGEPLEALDVIETLSLAFIDICKRNKKPYNAGITTNGYNLSVETMRKLKKLHITEFQITLDGLREIHDAQRILRDGSGTYQKIIDNLLNIKSKIKSSTITIVLRTNFSRELLEHINDFQKVLDDYFSEDSRFCFFWQLVGDYGYVRDESVRDIFGTMQDYVYLVRNYTDKFTNKFMFHLYGPAGSVCYALKRNSYVISSDGVIKKCTCDLENEENFFGQIGKTFDSEKHENWLKREIKENSQCYLCIKRPICHNKACYKAKSCLENLNYIEKVIDTISNDEKYYEVI